jgi:NADPH:quinone reductase-like Zn-dependent oxidoreductase
MRALRYDAFGPVAAVARLTEVAQPRPARGEVVVRVRFASVNPLDWKLVEGQFRLICKSRPPCGAGTDFSGTVEALGAGVSSPAIGTPVVGFINPGKRPPGALQQFVAIAARDVLPVDAADLEDACTLPVAGVSALQMCRLAGVGSGSRVLIHGAAGGVGSFAVQVVRMLGGTCTATGSRYSQETLAALHPQARINYMTQPVASWGGPFAAVLDCASTLGEPEIATLLASGGNYVRTLPSLPAVVLDPLLNRLRPIKRFTLRLSPNTDDLRALLTWLRRGRIKPVIGERFAFADAVAALERSKSGRAQGKLVVRIG